VKPRKAQIVSLLLHGGVVFAILHFGAVLQPPPDPSHRPLTWTATKLVYHLDKGDAKGGGAGRDFTPPSKGTPPRPAPIQLVFPTTRAPDHQPLLPVEPTILGETARPPATVAILGDPVGPVGPPSDGFGGRRGIGMGNDDGGAGNKSGPSAGDGPGGRMIGGSTLGLTTHPIVVHKVEPEFTEEARKARMQGTVVLLVDIDERGQVHNIRVRTPLGLGLDEKAIEAVRKWRFRPGTRNGAPVSTPALVEVNFRLL
jgi:periplasmic protein TonB